MEIVLTGRNFSAQEASEWGLVSRVVPEGQSVVDEAVKVAGKVASKSRIAVQAAKEGVNSGASVVCTGTRPPTRGTSAALTHGRLTGPYSARSLRALARAGPAPRAPPLPPALRDRASYFLLVATQSLLLTGSDALRRTTRRSA